MGLAVSTDVRIHGTFALSEHTLELESTESDWFGKRIEAGKTPDLASVALKAPDKFLLNMSRRGRIFSIFKSATPGFWTL